MKKYAVYLYTVCYEKFKRQNDEQTDDKQMKIIFEYVYVYLCESVCPMFLKTSTTVCWISPLKM